MEENNIFDMDLTRLMIVGCAGSGKSTLAVELGKVLGRAVTHLDKSLWGSNWQLPDYESRRKIHNKLISQDMWIIEGMWASLLEDRLTRATAVIVLDMSRLVCMYGIVSRFFKYRNKQRVDLAEGCKERLDREFVNYTWNFRKKKRPLLLQTIVSSNIPCVRVTNRRQQRQLVSQIISCAQLQHTHQDT